jgi:hypothetical protein
MAAVNTGDRRGCGSEDGSLVAMRMIQAGSAMLAASAALTGGCGATGESDPERRRAAERPSATPTVPEPLPGERARLEGRWRVTVTVHGSDELLARVRWRIRPDCRQGACGGTIVSSSSAELSLEEATSEGDYVAETDFSGPCGEEGEEPVAEYGFDVHRTDHLTVTDSVDTRRGPVATELSGYSKTEATAVEGVDPRCQDGTTYEDIRAVRLDRPDRG